jgi:hypothetical protein
LRQRSKAGLAKGISFGFVITGYVEVFSHLPNQIFKNVVELSVDFFGDVLNSDKLLQFFLSVLEAD